MGLAELVFSSDRWRSQLPGLDDISVTTPTGTIRPGALAGADLNVSYAMPTSNFVVWDPTNGNDGSAGTAVAPVQSIGACMAKISSGGTVVVRSGPGGAAHTGSNVGYKIASAAGYNASLGFGGIEVTKRCTIQPYPGERVIFDGTRDESGGWTAGSGYWSKPVVITVDRGATDSYGKLDNDARGEGWLWTRSTQWRNIVLSKYGDPASATFPLASWNEQVWIDDVKQEQVATLGEVTAGKFYVAGTAGGTNNILFTSSTYYLGTDPTGKQVRIGELCTSLRLSQAGSTLRGITFRRFIGSNHMGGVIKGAAADLTFENILADHAGCVSFELYQADRAVYRQCEAQYAGNTGFKHAGSSYDLLYDRCKAQFANWRRYNWSPVSGGLKGVVGRGVTVRDSNFTYNWTKGLWWDVSNYDVKVLNTAADFNEENGIVLEIGAKALVANCTVTNNGTHNILVLNNDSADIWNTSLYGCGRLKGQVYDGKSPRPIKAYSDDRRVVDSPPGSPGQGEYPSYGRDSRQPVPDPTMNNWLIQHFGLHNSIIASGTNEPQFAYLPIEDLQKNSGRSRNWTDYGISSNGNLFNRPTASNPAWAFLLPGAGTAQTIITTLSQWRSTTGQDAASIEVIGSPVTDADGWLTPAALALYGKGGAQCPAVPLPADVAVLIGQPEGDRHIGPYLATA